GRGRARLVQRSYPGDGLLRQARVRRRRVRVPLRRRREGAAPPGLGPAAGMTVVPSVRVLEGFGVGGAVVPLQGGQGEAFLVGDLVLKPAEDGGETAWVSELLEGLVV